MELKQEDLLNFDLVKNKVNNILEEYADKASEIAKLPISIHETNNLMELEEEMCLKILNAWEINKFKTDAEYILKGSILLNKDKFIYKTLIGKIMRLIPGGVTILSIGINSSLARRFTLALGYSMSQLSTTNMIVYCGGFSNSDVLGSAKGWAGGFLFNPKAKEALEKFYAREDTLSLGICNGCQLMMELGLINPEHEKKGKMLHNDSHKFESTYVGLTIPTNRSVMFGSLSGSKLGIWVAHGEGKFSLPYDEDQYNVVAKYSYDEYPGNPNGSDYSIAGLASADGRHLAMMPHLERAIFPWQNGCYPADRKNSDQITPWIEAFVNARKWVEEKTK